MKKAKRILAILLTVILLLTMLPVGALAARTVSVDPMAQYRLVNKATGKVLIRTNDNTYVSGRADVYKTAAAPYDADNNFAKWTLSCVGTNQYQLRNVGSSKAGLHKTNESYEAITGANHVVTVDNYSGVQQYFTMVDAGNGYVKFYNEYNETDDTYDKPQYLSVTSDSFNGSADTVYVALTAQFDTDNQLWQLEQVEGTGTEPLPVLDEFQRQTRKIQDALNVVGQGNVQIDGFVDSAIRRASNQEVKAWDWAKLVDQFRRKTDGDNGWRGEYWGKYMRGATFQYAYTQDAELYDILEATTRDLLSVQEASGRISSYPNDWGTWDVWSRKYIMLGLESFYSICKDEILKHDILTALCYHADYIIARLGPASEGKTELVDVGFWRGIASSSILEPMVILYNLTGFQRYLDYATYIVDSGCTNLGMNIFEMAYQNQVIPSEWYTGVVKAYEMTSCFEGLAEYYRVTGIEKWKIACLNYYRMLSENEITIAGSGCGWSANAAYHYPNPGQNENWNHLHLNQSDPTLVETQETCVTATWMKYCFQMLRLVGTSAAADDLEISIYNALFAGLKAEGVETESYPFVFTYFLSLSGQKPVPSGACLYDENGLPLGSCCSASGQSGIGLIPFIGVMNSTEGPVINLYHDSTVTTKTPGGQALILDLVGQYPFDDTVTITVTPEATEAFTLKLRIPAWSKQNSLLINGESQKNLVPGEYYAVTRTWKPGDTITLTLDLRTRLVEDPADMGYVALMRGPLVLARDSRFQDGDITTIPEVIVDDEGYVNATVVEEAFNSVVTVSIPCKDNKSILMCDYASAGQTWDSTSSYATWLLSEGNQQIQENTSYYLYCPHTQSAVTVGDENAVYKSTLPADGDVQSSKEWVFQKSGESYFIYNPATNYYLTAMSSGNGGLIQAQPYVGDASQLWNVTMNTRELFTLTSVLTGGLFSEEGVDTSKLHLWMEVGSPLQRYSVARVLSADAQAAAAVDAQIAAIGEVSLEQEAAIVSARAAYTALTDTQKALVGNLSILEAAEAALEALKNPAVTDVTLTLTGTEQTHVHARELTYTVSASDMVHMASIIVTVELDGSILADPVAVAADGWYIVVQRYEDNALTVVACNNAGVTGSGDLFTITAKPTGQQGQTTVRVATALLAAYDGEGERYVTAKLDNAFLSTNVSYSIYDINRDGIVDLLDITRAQRYYGTDTAIADVNQDHIVDISDLILILNHCEEE